MSDGIFLLSDHSSANYVQSATIRSMLTPLHARRTYPGRIEQTIRHALKANGVQRGPTGGNMEFVVPRNRTLSDLLSNASSADLEVLADLITDNGKGRIALDSSIKTVILNRQSKGNLQSIADVLEKEIRAFGSNSIVSLFRSDGVEYVELVTDVVKKLDGKPSDQDDIYSLEEIAIRQAASKYIEGGASIEALSGAALTALIGQIVPTLVASAGTVAGITATGGAAGIASTIGGRLASLVAPPLAVGVAGATVLQAASPAFRITVPAVLQVAKIRRLRYESDFAAYKESIRACL